MEERLHAYLDGELDAKAVATLEAELARDPEFAAKLGALRALYTRLDSLDEAPLTRDLRPAVLAAIDAAPVQRAWLAWLLPAEGALALILAALAAVFLSDRLPGFPDISASLQAQFANLLSGIQSLLGQSSQSLSSLGRLDPGNLVSLPSFDLPTLGLIGLAASLLLLGLIGNGLLLRTNRT